MVSIISIKSKELIGDIFVPGETPKEAPESLA